MIASDQRLVHTSFVPSKYWSRCAPLAWNEGFTTPLAIKPFKRLLFRNKENKEEEDDDDEDGDEALR
ncbi:unnamed protein product [Schistosoma margrebowiei]|uniref:Uncharacterized protein n=1 Tax=Schistosoma margrebowiei TaxID=48269 RepID=A0A183ME75_9TREM|nr:unnamed protein product [Schistosoma margrebowiei]